MLHFVQHDKVGGKTKKASLVRSLSI